MVFGTLSALGCGAMAFVFALGAVSPISFGAEGMTMFVAFISDSSGKQHTLGSEIAAVAVEPFLLRGWLIPSRNLTTLSRISSGC